MAAGGKKTAAGPPEAGRGKATKAASLARWRQTEAQDHRSQVADPDHPSNPGQNDQRIAVRVGDAGQAFAPGWSEGSSVMGTPWARR